MIEGNKNGKDLQNYCAIFVGSYVENSMSQCHHCRLAPFITTHLNMIQELVPS